MSFWIIRFNQWKMSYLWQRICCVFEKCYIRRHIKLYMCYVVTKEMLYMWQRICPVLDKCYIRGHKWHLFGCRSICRVEGDNFDNFHPFVFDNHHHLCLRQSSSSFNTVQRKGLLFMLDGTDSTVHLKMLKRIEEGE